MLLFDWYPLRSIQFSLDKVQECDVSTKTLQAHSYVYGHTYLLMMILEFILDRNDKITALGHLHPLNCTKLNNCLSKWKGSIKLSLPELVI